MLPVIILTTIITMHTENVEISVNLHRNVEQLAQRIRYKLTMQKENMALEFVCLQCIYVDPVIPHMCAQ